MMSSVQSWQLPVIVQKLVNQARQSGQAIVLVTGVFDLLHEEHRQFLQKAKAQGQVLLIGLESDLRVRKLKGEGRPVNLAEVRQRNLEAWQLADGIFILPEQFSQPTDHEAVIAQIRPAVLAVSSHTAHLPEKQAILQKYGGQVIVVHEFNPRVSTTQLLAQNQKGTHDRL